MKKTLNEVFLNKNVKNLGKPGTIVKVKRGYSRNYLLPFQLAKRATRETIEQFKLTEQNLLQTKQDSQQKTLEFKKALENLDPLIFEKEVIYDTEQLFGKITRNEIFSLLEEKVKLPEMFEKNQISLSNINELGKYVIPIMLNNDITATISIIIQAK